MMVAITYECPNCYWYTGHAENCPSWYKQEEETGMTTKRLKEYPEHEKLKAKQREVSVLSIFIDFIAEQGWELAEFHDKDERLWSIHKRPEDIIGMFLGIDPKKLETEKRAMLAEIRAANNAKGKRP